MLMCNDFQCSHFACSQKTQRTVLLWLNMHAQRRQFYLHPNKSQRGVPVQGEVPWSDALEANEENILHTRWFERWDGCLLEGLLGCSVAGCSKNLMVKSQKGWKLIFLWVKGWLLDNEVGKRSLRFREKFKRFECPKFVTRKIQPKRRNLSTPSSNIQHGGFTLLISANNPDAEISFQICH